MGKTLGAIITVGLAVAVNVIPGAGQFISGAISAGMAAVGGTAFALSTTALTVAGVVGTGLTLGITAAGLQSLSGVLGLGPSSPKPDTSETAIKNARPPRVSAYGESRLYGAYGLYETAEDGTAVDVFFVHDGEIEGVTQYYLGDEKVTVSPVNGEVTGLADGAYASDTVRLFSTKGRPTETAITRIIELLPSIWTTAHRGDGIVTLAATFRAVKSKHYLEIYPNGIPVASIAAKWQKCPDPYAVDVLDESQWTWTENSIRHLLHYMIVREQVNFNQKILPVIDYWRTASDVCNEQIPLKAGGFENRYRSCVSHKHIDTHASVKSSLMQTCDGWMAQDSNGSFIVYAGKYTTPTVSITPDDIISYEWNGVGVDDDEIVNEIMCSYTSKAHDFNTVETDSWRDEDDILERGKLITDSLEPQAPSWGQVRRLAKRNMSRKNALYRGTVTTNVDGRKVRGQRYINLRLEEAGMVFFNGPAEIIAVTRNLQTGGVTFSWAAADPNIDAWNPITEEGDPAPTANRIAPQPILTPVIEDATAQFSSDGSFVQIRIDAGDYDRTDLTWFTRWKRDSDSSWVEVEATDMDTGDDVILLTTSVPVDSSIDVAISYSNGIGQVSSWSATETVSTSTAMLAPNPVTLVESLGGVGQATTSWRNPETPFEYVRIDRNTTDDLSTATQINGDILGANGATMVYDDLSLSAGTYYYWIRSVSSNGVLSVAVATGSVVVT